MSPADTLKSAGTKAFDKVKGNLQKIGIIILAMFLSYTPLLSWIPYLQVFFIVMFVSVLITPKSKVYSEVRERVEGQLEKLEIPEQLYRKAFAAGFTLQELTAFRNAMHEQHKSQADMLRELQDAINAREVVRRAEDEEEEQYGEYR